MANFGKRMVKEDLIKQTATIDYVDQSVTGLVAQSEMEEYVSDALEDYTPTANLATVATSGSYNDLTDKPEIPECTIKELVYTTKPYFDDATQTTINAWLKAMPVLVPTEYYETAAGVLALNGYTNVIESKMGDIYTLEGWFGVATSANGTSFVEGTDVVRLFITDKATTNPFTKNITKKFVGQCTSAKGFRFHIVNAAAGATGNIASFVNLPGVISATVGTVSSIIEDNSGNSTVTIEATSASLTNTGFVGITTALSLYADGDSVLPGFNLKSQLQLPIPATDGTYNYQLQITVADGVPTYS